MNRMRWATVLILAVSCAAARPELRAISQDAPKGFTKLFNGKDLTGWRGRQGDYSVYAEAKLTPEEKAAKQALWNTDRDLNWTVDTAKGELVSNGKGVFLTTDKDYGDFEFYVDWLMVSPNGDSGVYLRGYPLSQYFNAFDFSISAAGYNTFHEIVSFDLPSIFIPNRSPTMDDQAGRATHAQDRHASFELEEADLGDLPDLVELLIDAKARDFLRSNSRALHRPNGANDAALALTRLLGAAE